MSAPFPLFPQEAFGHEVGLVIGTLVGFAFGFVLERSGFGRAPVLASQFYGADNRVLKVMFSAIATALIGIAVLAGTGALEVGLLAVPETYLWPQLAGGLLLGIGFVVSGYCPGTSVVGAASGNLDAVVTFAGVMAGSLLFGALYPVFAEFYLSGEMGVARLPDLLGVAEPLLVLAVLVMAAGAFFGAEALERLLARRRGTPVPAGRPAVRNRVLAGLGAAAALGLATLAVPRAGSAPPEKAFAAIDALALARDLVERPADLHVVDLRGGAACATARIPGALCLAPSEIAGLAPTRTLVLYGERDLQALPEAAARFPGRVLLLAGGWAAFRSAILSPAPPPPTASAADIAGYRLRAALRAHFTGARVREAPPAAPAPVMRTATKKKAGGC